MCPTRSSRGSPPVRPTSRNSRPSSAIWRATTLGAPRWAGLPPRTCGRLAENDATARGYEEAIEAPSNSPGTRARVAMARWSGALSDIGVDDDLVRDEGFGVSYAEALEEFTRTP